MTRSALFLLTGLVIGGAVGGAVGFRLARGGAAGEEPADGAAVVQATARIDTAAIAAGSLPRVIVAFGTVAPAADAISALTLPYECRVRRLLVTLGQAVAAGAPVLEVEPSAEARLQLREARAAREAAAGALAAAQRRFESRLATNQDLAQARNELALADLRLAEWTARGADDAAPSTIVAPVAGAVTLLAAKPGAVVAAGTALAEVADPARVDARLGLAPDQARAVASGQRVALAPVGAGTRSACEATIAAIAVQVDPATRLVDAIARVPAGSGLIAGEAVRAEIELPAIEGLTVPRAAVLIDDEGAALFIVVDGKAARRPVTILAEDGERAVVAGEGVAAGDRVVVAGNHQLEDGMAVDAGPAR